jgi:hypothetical protein
MLGAPVQQVQQGLVSQGDVAWKIGQLERGVQNNIFAQQTSLNNALLTPRDQSKILSDIMEQTRGLNALRQYGSVAAGMSMPGGQQITIGERAIAINVYGAQNPEATGKAVFNEFRTNLNSEIGAASYGNTGALVN